MNDYASGLATKGILSDSLANKGFMILFVEETIIRPRKGVGDSPTKKAKRRKK